VIAESMTENSLTLARMRGLLSGIAYVAADGKQDEFVRARLDELLAVASIDAFFRAARVAAFHPTVRAAA